MWTQQRKAYSAGLVWGIPTLMCVQMGGMVLPGGFARMGTRNEGGRIQFVCSIFASIDGKGTNGTKGIRSRWVMRDREQEGKSWSARSGIAAIGGLIPVWRKFNVPEPPISHGLLVKGNTEAVRQASVRPLGHPRPLLPAGLLERIAHLARFIGDGSMTVEQEGGQRPVSVARVTEPARCYAMSPMRPFRARGRARCGLGP
jgi:hypothetical protein